MTTAADIIKQYGRVLEHDTTPGEIEYSDLGSDLHTLAIIVSDYGNNTLPDDQADTTRKNLEICLAGQDHWWWNCDDQNCNEATE